MNAFRRLVAPNHNPVAASHRPRGWRMFFHSVYILIPEWLPAAAREIHRHRRAVPSGANYKQMVWVGYQTRMSCRAAMDSGHCHARASAALLLGAYRPGNYLSCECRSGVYVNGWSLAAICHTKVVWPLSPRWRCGEQAEKPAITELGTSQPALVLHRLSSIERRSAERAPVAADFDCGPLPSRSCPHIPGRHARCSAATSRRYGPERLASCTRGNRYPRTRKTPRSGE
jgi:hypothetical protein